MPRNKRSLPSNHYNRHNNQSFVDVAWWVWLIWPYVQNRTVAIKRCITPEVLNWIQLVYMYSVWYTKRGLICLATRSLHTRFKARLGKNTGKKVPFMPNQPSKLPLNFVSQMVLFSCNFGVFISNLCIWTISLIKVIIKKRVVRKHSLVMCWQVRAPNFYCCHFNGRAVSWAFLFLYANLGLKVEFSACLMEWKTRAAKN